MGDAVAVPTLRVLVVRNPAAGGQAGELAATVTARLEAMGSSVETAETAPGPDGVARVVAVAHGFDLVVSAGGDGTARQVAEGLARGLGRWPHGRTGPAPESGPALLVAPGGTGNSVYRALWGDRPFGEVFDDALAPDRHRLRHLDLGRIEEDDRAFLLGASAGFLARVVEVSQRLQGVSGRERYEAAAVAALDGLRPFPGRVTVDGMTVAEGPLTLVSIGGARHRAGTFQLLPRSVLDDGLLDVCAVAELSQDGFVELAAEVVAGEHLGRPEVAYARGSSIVVERTDGESLAVEADGDLRPSTGSRVTIAVVPAAVPVLAPFEPVAG